MNKRKAIATGVFVMLMLMPPETLFAATTASALAALPGEVDPVALGTNSTGDTAIQGSVQTKGAKAAAGEVAALAWPNEEYLKKLRAGDIVPTPTIGWTRSNSRGSFDLRIDGTRVGADFRNANGSVNVTLVGWADGAKGTWFTSAVIGNGVAAAKTGTSDLPPAESVVIRLTDSTYARGGASSRGMANAAVQPAAGACYTYYTGVSYDAWDVMGETWPYGSHVGKMVLTSGHGHSMGVAISLSGSYGSFSYNGDQSVSTSTTDDFGYNTAYRNYQMQTHYQRFNSNCGGVTVKPAYALGYYQTAGLAGYPSWSNCGTAVGEWTRSDSNGNSYSLSGGVKLGPYIGLDVHSSTNYSSTRTLSYYHPGTYHVCGNDAAAGLASKVKSAP